MTANHSSHNCLDLCCNTDNVLQGNSTLCHMFSTGFLGCMISNLFSLNHDMPRQLHPLLLLEHSWSFISCVNFSAGYNDCSALRELEHMRGHLPWTCHFCSSAFRIKWNSAEKILYLLRRKILMTWLEKAIDDLIGAPCLEPSAYTTVELRCLSEMYS